jgi:hypothetical protein
MKKINKTIEKIAKRLLDNGEEMICFNTSYKTIGAFGDGSVSYWVSLKDNYRFGQDNQEYISIHEQSADMVWELKNGEIHKLVEGQYEIYILDKDGKPENFNPFTNGTYKRRKAK